MTLDSDQQLRRLAAQIAAQLGDGWQPDQQRDTDWGHDTHLRQGDDPDAPRLSLAGEDWRANSRGRIRITGSWPPDRHPYPYHLHTPSITVAACRGAEVIAKEITRRLLPAYREGLASVIANNDQDRRDADAMYAAVGRLAGTLRPFAQRVTVRNWAHPTSAEVHGSLDEGGACRTVDAKVNHNGIEVTVELRGLSVDAAALVLRALDTAAALEAAKPIPIPLRCALTAARRGASSDARRS